MSRVIAFAGPCLPREPTGDWQRLLAEVEIRAPAQRGDVLAALVERPDTLVLLDGFYYTVPAVTHKELLYALDAGTNVIGAASMGALRAAELERFGMIGVGRVFRYFRDGEIEGDDEVAILHLDREHGYRQCTWALVEIRDALRQLAGQAPMPEIKVERLIRSIQRLSFTERCPETVLALAGEHLGANVASRLERRLRRPGVKRSDACQALRRAASLGRREGVGTRRPTRALSIFCERYMRVAPRMHDASGAITLQAAWNTFQVLHPEAPSLVRAVRRRHLLAAAASEAGLTVANAVVRSMAEELGNLMVSQRGSYALPATELIEEARKIALARAAVKHWGDHRAAAAALGRPLGFPAARAESRLQRLFELDAEMLPSWVFVRAFTLSSAFWPASTTAAAATEIERCFHNWAHGARPTRGQLEAIAAGLWGCDRESVRSEAVKRSLFDFGGAAPGFDEAVGLVAAAERLERPINDYPNCRARLLASPSALPWTTEGLRTARHEEPPERRLSQC